MLVACVAVYFVCYSPIQMVFVLDVAQITQLAFSHVIYADSL